MSAQITNAALCLYERSDYQIIIPFATSGGSDIGGTVADLKGSIDASAMITEGKVLNGKQAKESLTTWVDSLEL